MTSTFYPPYHIGGDATHIKLLAEELVKKGHEVHVMHSLDAYQIKKKEIPKKMDYNDVYIHALHSPLNLNPYLTYVLGNSNFTLKKFESILNKVKPDIVHHHNISLLGYKLFKKKGCYKNFYTAHDYWLICQKNNLFREGKLCNKRSCFFCVLRSKRPYQLWRMFNGFKNSIRDIDVVITPSNYIKNRLLEKLNLNAITIPNFVSEPPSEIKNSDFSDFFLYVGVLEKHKGILNLLEIFKKYGNEIDAKLLIMGEGTLENYIKRFIRSNNLEKTIVFLGWKDHSSLYPLYRDTLALIIPSIWPENAPLVALESLSVGTPVIGSDRGGIPEIVEKVDANLIFRASDMGDFKRILTDYNKEKYPTKRVKKVFKRNYSAEGYFNKYYKLLI